MLRIGIFSVDECAAGMKRFLPHSGGLKMKL
jgi:hypothetical protein